MSENSEAKWTAGPWKATRLPSGLWNVHAANRPARPPIAALDFNPDDARLIAAAPDLYTGLMHQIYRNHPYTENCDGCRQSIAALRSARGTR